jgi:hypothetical protein
MALVLALVAWSAGSASAEIVIGGPAPFAPPRPAAASLPFAWSATMRSTADQVHTEGRLRFGVLSAGIGTLARVGDDARFLHHEGLTAGVRAERGAFAIDVDWVDYGAHRITHLVDGVIAGDSILVPAHTVVSGVAYPTRGFLLTASFHRAPFALDLRTVTRGGTDGGRLLPGQAIAEWELGRAALLAGFGRPARLGRLGYEPQAFAGVSLSLGPRAGASAGAQDVAPAGPAFRAFRSGGFVRLEVDAPRARRVEVASDASAWEPAVLAPAGKGHWEGMIAAGPGTLRLLMRVDGGAWLPPPGLPVAHEPTTGDVGILVLDE